MNRRPASGQRIWINLLYVQKQLMSNGMDAESAMRAAIGIVERSHEQVQDGVVHAQRQYEVKATPPMRPEPEVTRV